MKVTQNWLGQIAGTELLHKVGRATGALLLAFLWVDLCLSSRFWAPRVLRVVFDFQSEIHRRFETFMRGHGPQIAALAREIAGLKSRLLFLWNSERVRRTRNRQEGESFSPTQRSIPSVDTVVTVHSVGQFSSVCIFVVGSLFGGLATASSIALGIWIGRLSISN